MNSGGQKRKNEEMTDSDSSCKIVAYLGDVGNTMSDSDEEKQSEKFQAKTKRLKKPTKLHVTMKLLQIQVMK